MKYTFKELLKIINNIKERKLEYQYKSKTMIITGYFSGDFIGIIVDMHNRTISINGCLLEVKQNSYYLTKNYVMHLYFKMINDVEEMRDNNDK